VKINMMDTTTNINNNNKSKNKNKNNKKRSFIRNIFKNNYEKMNVVSSDGDSIYELPIEQVKAEGQIYVSEEKIRDIVKEELKKLFGGSTKDNEL
jgi:protoporphyrinogen oxidase